MKHISVLSLLFCCAAAAPASAQATFGQVRAEGTPTVVVTDRNGVESEGRLVTFSESEITIRAGAVTRMFPAAEVSLIERKGDSLKNGAIIGAIVGIVASGLSASEVCAGRTTKRSCVGQGAAYVIIGTAFYAAVGAGIDALIPGRTRIWPARP